MAKVLFGWELGGGRGHAVRALRSANALEANGHEVLFALQKPHLLSREEAGGRQVWQAPVTPRLMVGGAIRGRAPTSSMADVYARLGFNDPNIVSGMVRAWRQLLATVNPDIVIADAAPFLAVAASGDVPRIRVGPGFATPPSHLERFPILMKSAKGVDQDALLAVVNRGLADAGKKPLERLPQAVAVERDVVATFQELDPYAGSREQPLVSPLPEKDWPTRGDGEEVFVYLSKPLPADTPLIEGLAQSGLPIRIVTHAVPAALKEKMSGNGFKLEEKPVPFAAIAERSRLIVSLGVHGLVCEGVASGIPHIACFVDLEKKLVGDALMQHGLGGAVALSSIDPEKFGADLKRLHGDEALAANVAKKADEIRSRNQPLYAQALAEAVTALA